MEPTWPAPIGRPARARSVIRSGAVHIGRLPWTRCGSFPSSSRSPLLRCSPLAGSARGAEAGFQRTVVVSGLSSPLDVASTRTEPRRLYVVEQRGTIRVLDRGKLRKGLFLDVRKLLVVSGGEQVLLRQVRVESFVDRRRPYSYLNGDTRVVRYKTNGTRAHPLDCAHSCCASTSRTRTTTAATWSSGPNGRVHVRTGDGPSGGCRREPRPENADAPRGDAAPRRQEPRLGADDCRARPAEPLALLVDRAHRRPLHRRRRSRGDVRGDRRHAEVGRGLLNYGWEAHEGSRQFEDKAPGPGTLVFPVYQAAPTTAGAPWSAATSTAARPPRRSAAGTSSATTAAVRSRRLRMAGGNATAVRPRRTRRGSGA